VLIVGGSGRIGAACASLLARDRLVSELLIGARDLGLARKVAKDIGRKATAVRLDVQDQARLASAASRCDLIVNTAGPDFRVALPVARAAIEAGVDCVDISADGGSVENLIALDNRAKRSDVTLVTGIGHAPGLTNLLMEYAARNLDRVTDLRACVWWDLSREAGLFGDLAEMRKSGRISASWQQIFAWVAGKVRWFRRGRLVHVNPFEEMRLVTLPTGQVVTAVPIGSTEPITLPRAMPGLRSVSILMGLHPPQVWELLQEQAVRVAEGEVESAAGTLAFLEALSRDPRRWLRSRTRVPSTFGMVAFATGRKAGIRTRRTCTCWPSGPWESTVGPLTVAALRVLRRDVPSHGVLAPEKAFRPLPFLREAAAYGPAPPQTARFVKESEKALAKSAD